MANRTGTVKVIMFLILLSSLFFTTISVEKPVGVKLQRKNWDEMIASRKTALAKLPGYDDFPDNATTWEDYAERCFEELLIEDDSWTIEAGVKSFRPYVKGADGWGENPEWIRESTELMAAMDVLWPMYRYLQIHPNGTRQTMVDEFIQEMPKYYAEPFKQTINNPYTTHTNYKHDSWYYVENSILKYGHLYLISNATTLEDPYYGSLESGLEMAHNFNYLFPQFVEMNTKQVHHQNYGKINYCTAGLLAYSMIHAYQMTNDTSYLVEAEKCLTALRGVEWPDEAMYEPQELAAATSAAAHMIQYAELINSTTDFAKLAMDFFYAEEQVLYYDNGKIDWTFGFNPSTSAWLPSNWRDGMHSPYANPKEIGSGGINAPAFKENFESIMFWVDYLKYIYFKPDFKAEEPLKILNLNRIKNFYFFSPNIPDTYERFYGPTTLQFIPYEDIDYHWYRDKNGESSSVTDLKLAGYNGKEIYGAGEVLWAYLMYEALGTAADKNAMIINLNMFDKDYPAISEKRAYIVFNPYSSEKTLSFTLKQLVDPYDIYAGSTKLGNFQPGDSFNITLPAYGSAYITLSESLIPTDTITTTSDTTPSTPPVIFGFFGISTIALSLVIYYAATSKKRSN
ncbi:MAG: hypothetical protein ACXADA_16985 [Candidatus Hodarchaeales archaeon]